MSQKNSKPEKKKPRAMPVEAIVTRFKSAQQKQLLEKDQLKHTTKSKNNKSPKTVQTNLKNSEKKSLRHKKVQKLNKKSDKDKEKIDNITLESTEYYPNKLKRKVLSGKVFLAPKHCFKVICGTKSCNKRKLHVPQRDAKYIKEPIHHNGNESPKQNQSELSITDMVRIIEESGSLDDEDLLEILTCPSPVWWEAPPDGYIEEPLISQTQSIDKHNKNNQNQEEQKNDTEEEIHQKEESNNNKIVNEIKQESLDITICNKDKNFINKRCKLEALLGNIRNKIRPIIKDDSYKNETDNKENKKEETKRNKVKTDSECIEEDLSEFRDDEILKHLENLEIPIEMSIKKEDLDIKESVSRRISIESNRSDKNMSEEYLDLSLLDEYESYDHDDVSYVHDDEIVDEKLYTEHKNELNHSNKSVNLTNSSASDSSQTEHNLDQINELISDHSGIKNIKQNNLDEINNEIEQSNKKITSNIIDADNDEIDKEKNYSKDNQNEYVTVYKIINNDTYKETQSPQIKLNEEKIEKRLQPKDKIDGKINSYYKCKKIQNNKTSDTKTDIDNENFYNYEDKTIVISETDKVKYCFVCSSIFDTEKCNYCVRKTLKRKLSEYTCLDVNT